MNNYLIEYHEKDSDVFYKVVIPSDTAVNAYASFKEKYSGYVMVKIEKG